MTVLPLVPDRSANRGLPSTGRPVVNAIVASFGVLLSSSIAWADSPSFDCKLAATPTEEVICDEEIPGLGMRDAALARLYQALKDEGGHETVLSGQAAWLKTRDACGVDIDCLRARYDDRLLTLAREAGDEGGATGTYQYKLDEDAGSGEAFIVREYDGTLSGSIETVSGPTYHVCGIDFSAAEPIGDTWLWIGPEEEGDGDGTRCHILFRAAEGYLRIDSNNCRYYCGARGFFDESYTRAE